MAKLRSVVEVGCRQDGDAWSCDVQVEHTGERTWHAVWVTKADLERWGRGAEVADVEDLVRQSFGFLLEREPPSSILPRFDLSVIPRYFPDYDQQFKTMKLTGTVEHIHIAELAGALVQAVPSIEAVAGVGLAGDRNARREGTWRDDRSSRDVTLIEAENIENLARDFGIRLAPGETRRNITTRGVRLNDLVGKEFWIGDVLARGTKLCEPCTYLANLIGKPIVEPLVHRAGLRAELLTSGRIAIGDRVEAKA